MLQINKPSAGKKEQGVDWVYHDLEAADGLEQEREGLKPVQGKLLSLKAAATPFIKTYFLMMGFSSVMPFVFNYATIDIGEKKYRGYYYAFFSMLSCNLSIVTVVPFIKLLQHTSFSFQINLSLVGVLASVLGMSQLLQVETGSPLRYFLLNLTLVLACTFKYFYQSSAIRIATFYDDSCVAYFYTGIPVGNLVSCSLRILLAYLEFSDEAFMTIYVVVVSSVMLASFFLHSHVSASDHYLFCAANFVEEKERLTLVEIKETYRKIAFEVWVSFFTNLLHGTFFPAPAYYLAPDGLSFVYWCNIVTILGAVADSLGRYLGDLMGLSWVVRWFYWYPVFAGATVTYFFIMNDPSLNRQYIYPLLAVLTLLSFRTGFSITHFASQINKLADQNASILTNYSIGAGYFFSGFASFVIIAFKKSPPH